MQSPIVSFSPKAIYDSKLCSLTEIVLNFNFKNATVFLPFIEFKVDFKK